MQNMTAQYIDYQQLTSYLNNQLLIQKERGCVNRTSSGVALWQQLNHFQMKKFVLSLFAVAAAFVGTAQDAGQPQGSWYLGTGDATTLLNVFSSGVAIAPTVGYAVADDIVIQASANGPTDDMGLNLGAAYFMGDYWVGLQATDVAGDLDAGLAAGTYIDFKDVLFLTPNVQYSFGLPDGSSDNLSIGIGFGARF